MTIAESWIARALGLMEDGLLVWAKARAEIKIGSPHRNMEFAERKRLSVCMDRERNDFIRLRVTRRSEKWILTRRSSENLLRLPVG
jgi:hypothetical protein